MCFWSQITSSSSASKCDDAYRRLSSARLQPRNGRVLIIHLDNASRHSMEAGRILLMRRAEKPDSSGDVNLSPAGHEHVSSARRNRPSIDLGGRQLRWKVCVRSSHDGQTNAFRRSRKRRRPLSCQSVSQQTLVPRKTPLANDIAAEFALRLKMPATRRPWFCASNRHEMCSIRRATPPHARAILFRTQS